MSGYATGDIVAIGDVEYRVLEAIDGEPTSVVALKVGVEHKGPWKGIGWKLVRRGATDDEAADLRAERDQLSSDLQEARAERDAAREAYDKLLTSWAELKALRDGVARDLTEAREQLQASRDEVDDLLHREAEAREQLAQVRREAAQASAGFDAAYDALRSPVDRLTALVAAAYARVPTAQQSAPSEPAANSCDACSEAKATHRICGSCARAGGLDALLDAPSADVPSEPATRCAQAGRCPALGDVAACGVCAPSADVQAPAEKAQRVREMIGRWREEDARDDVQAGDPTCRGCGARTTDLRVAPALGALCAFCRRPEALEDLQREARAQPRAEERVSHENDGNLGIEDALTITRNSLRFNREKAARLEREKAELERRARELCKAIEAMDAVAWEGEYFAPDAHSWQRVRSAATAITGELLTEPTGATTGENDAK